MSDTAQAIIEINEEAILIPELEQTLMGLGRFLSSDFAAYDYNKVMDYLKNNHPNPDQKFLEYLTDDDNSPIFIDNSVDQKSLHLLNGEALIPDGYSDAYMGIVYRGGLKKPIAIIDLDKCVTIFCSELDEENTDEDYTNEDIAWEYFEFNMINAYVGEGTPFYFQKIDND